MHRSYFIDSPLLNYIKYKKIIFLELAVFIFFYFSTFHLKTKFCHKIYILLLRETNPNEKFGSQCDVQIFIPL